MMNSTRPEIDPSCGSSLQYKIDAEPKTDPYDIK